MSTSWRACRRGAKASRAHHSAGPSIPAATPSTCPRGVRLSMSRRARLRGAKASRTRRSTGPSIPAVTCAPSAVRVAYPPVGDVTGLYPVLQDDGKIPVPPADGGVLVTPRPVTAPSVTQLLRLAAPTNRLAVVKLQLRESQSTYRKIGPEGTARRGCALMLGPPVPSPTGLCALPAGYGLGLCVP